MSPLPVPHNSFYSILKIIRSHWMVLHVCSHERFCNIVRKIVKNHNKLPKIYSASGVTSIIRGFTGFPVNPKINLLFFTLYIMLSILADYLHPFHCFCRSQINHLVTFWMKGLYVIMFIFFLFPEHCFSEFSASTIAASSIAAALSGLNWHLRTGTDLNSLLNRLTDLIGVEQVSN